MSVNDLVEMVYQKALLKDPKIKEGLVDYLQAKMRTGQILSSAAGGLGGASSGYYLSKDEEDPTKRLAAILGSGALGAASGFGISTGVKKSIMNSARDNFPEMVEREMREKGKARIMELLTSKLKAQGQVSPEEMSSVVNTGVDFMVDHAKKVTKDFGGVVAGSSLGTMALSGALAGTSAPAAANKLKNISLALGEYVNSKKNENDKT